MSIVGHHGVLMRVSKGPYIPPGAPPGTVPFSSPGDYWEIVPQSAGLGYSYGYDPTEQKWFATRPTPRNPGGTVLFRSLPAYEALDPAYLVLEVTFIGADGSTAISNSFRPDSFLGGTPYRSEPNPPGTKLFTLPSSQSSSAGSRRIDMYKFYGAAIGDGFIVNFAGYIP